MRTLDRETREFQEKQWIYMLHQQNPPLTRQATPAPLEHVNGLIPLGSVHTTPTHLSPLSPSFPSPHSHSALSSWTPSLTPTTKIPNAPMQFGGMIKVDTKSVSAPYPFSITPQSDVHFRPLLTKPSPIAHNLTISTTPTATKRSTKQSGIIPVSKRPRDSREPVEQDGKRSCLPKKCDFPMCQNSSRSRGFCYSHGGGRRCRMEGCVNGAVSRDLCKRHGGGRRCRIPGCKSSAESGGLCYSHGGGRRCQLSWCLARAKKGGYCNLHIDDQNASPPSNTTVHHKKNTDVVESLLCLSKSEPEEEQEKEDTTLVSSPTSPLSVLEMTRPYNPYALACILN